MTTPNSLIGAFTHRSVLRRMLRPVVVFAAIVVIGVMGFSTVDGIGIVDALFWLLDPTSIELHFQNHDGPATLIKGYAIVVLSGLVVAGLWIGETVFSAAFGGQIQDELKRSTGASSRTLFRVLDDLQETNFVARRLEEDAPVATYYSLTEKGTSLCPVFDEIEAWSEEWL